jgi:AcrR family transcriptional regulator
VNTSTAAVTHRKSHAERTDLSDTRMLDAAIALIVERGAEKTTLKEVGERAGYSRGLAGSRFGSKEGLFIFVVKSVGETWLLSLKQVTEGKSGIDAVTAAVDAHLEFILDAPDHVRAFYLLWFESIGPVSGVREVIAGIHERRRRDVVEWVRSGIDDGNIDQSVDPGFISGQFCAAIIGIVYQWLITPDNTDENVALHRGLNKNMELLLRPVVPAEPAE